MRLQRGVVWPYLLLTVAMLGALSFGIYQTRQRNHLALETENKYMSAFHKLKWNSENIEDRTAKLMATNDPRMQESLLADLRVYSASAVEEMAALPLVTMNIPNIESFLNTIRTKSDEFHHKLNRDTPLSDGDWRQLEDLRAQSVTFEKELSTLLGLVGSGHIRWSHTVRVTGPAQTGNARTPITNSVMLLDKSLSTPAAQPGTGAPKTGVSAPPPGGPMAKPRVDPGPPVGPAAASAAIKRFVDLPLQGEPQLTGTSDAADEGHTLSLFFFSARKSNGTPLDFGVSIHGGHVIYMIDGRPVKERHFAQKQLVSMAQQMLQRWGYPAVEFVSAVENDGTMVMDFAPKEGGMAVEVDTLKVMLAMDNGELVGFDGRNYWINRHPRQVSRPALTAAAAQARLSPRLKVDGVVRLALIADRQQQERLVWEVPAKSDGQHYRVFIDATSGAEVDVQRLQGDPAPPMGEGT